MLILHLLQSEVVAYDTELFNIVDRDIKILNSGTFSVIQVLNFLNTMCFSPFNRCKIADNMMDYLSSVLDGCGSEIEQELAATIISTVLSN